MKLLLDTHSLIWFLWADPRLSSPALAAINDPANTVYISPASLWELAIKVSTGKLTLRIPFDDFVDLVANKAGISVLAFTLASLKLVACLPFHHRDPFDRMLVAQSLAEGMSIVSVDPVLDAYGVPRIW